MNVRELLSDVKQHVAIRWLSYRDCILLMEKRFGWNGPLSLFSREDSDVGPVVCVRVYKDSPKGPLNVFSFFAARSLWVSFHYFFSPSVASLGILLSVLAGELSRPLYQVLPMQ